MPPATALEDLAEGAGNGRPGRVRRMLVVANPYATTVTPRLRQLVVAALQSRYEVDAVDTERPRHATELSAEAAREGYDVVLAFGGDGTVNEAANGLVGTDTALTCLPGGATNVYHRMLGLSTSVVEATGQLLDAAPTFAPRRVEARFGPWFYAQSALGTFMARYVVNPPRVVVEAGGTELTGVSVFVQNGQPYTYFRRRPVRLAEEMQLDSGDFAGVVLTRANAVDVPTIGFRLLARNAQVGQHRRVTAFDRLSELRVRSFDDRPVPVQVDGDFIGTHDEAVFSVAPGALFVVGA
jgi:diacylglycerol kinase family enzyme